MNHSPNAPDAREPFSKRLADDLAAIVALDWLECPRTGLEYIELVELGRKLNASLKSRQGHSEATLKKAPSKSFDFKETK